MEKMGIMGTGVCARTLMSTANKRNCRCRHSVNQPLKMSLLCEHLYLVPQYPFVTSIFVHTKIMKIMPLSAQCEGALIRVTLLRSFRECFIVVFLDCLCLALCLCPIYVSESEFCPHWRSKKRSHAKWISASAIVNAVTPCILNSSVRVRVSLSGPSFRPVFVSRSMLGSQSGMCRPVSIYWQPLVWGSRQKLAYVNKQIRPVSVSRLTLVS